jgi:hypothetical protein
MAISIPTTTPTMNHNQYMTYSFLSCATAAVNAATAFA